MTPFNWLEIVLYIGVFQGFFLSFSLPRISKENKKANVILALLLLSASLSLLLYLNTLYRSSLPIQAHGFLDTFPFLFGPLIYLYFKRLLFPEEKSTKLLLHFLPALGHFTYVLLMFRYGQEELSSMVSSGVFISQWVLIFSILISLLFSYWIASLSLVLRFKKQDRKVIAIRKNIMFLSVFLGAVLLGYFICIVFSVDFFFGVKLFSFTGPNLGWVLIPLLVYFISYNALIQPEALKITFLAEKRSLPRIGEADLVLYKQQLEKVMKEEKLYLDPLLKSKHLAEKINLDTTKLSWLINETYGCNFYDFINNYRITEFLERLAKNDHQKHTLGAIAYDVGFNSKTTFNKSFKKITQYTPGEYIQKLKSRQAISAQPISMYK